MPTCAQCGLATDEHVRDVRFRLPDVVFAAADQGDREGTWKSDDDPDAAVMMDVPDVGSFLRALLDVKLTGGYAVTFGVWVEVTQEELKRAYDSWWAPEYADLRISGRLANRLPSWDVVGAPLSVVVVDPDSLPWCVESSDPDLNDVLTREWDHAMVLAELPS